MRARTRTYVGARARRSDQDTVCDDGGGASLNRALIALSLNRALIASDQDTVCDDGGGASLNRALIVP